MDNEITGNFKLMREMNTAIILRKIREAGPISQTEIAASTSLTAATVSRIVNELRKRGIVDECGYGESSGGRKPVLLELNARAALVVGIAVEVEKTIGVVVDLNGRIIGRAVTEHKAGLNQKNIISELESMISSFINHQKYGDKIIGIGIGMHGLVDYSNGVSVYPPAFNWTDLPLADIISDKYELPVLLDNNDRVLALSEHNFGKASGYDNFICIKVGQGIGSGIFINGEIYRGVSVGEVGHITVAEKGEQCRCGNYGCLESMASIPAIIKRLQNEIKQDKETGINDLVSGELSLIDEKVINQAARNGDKLTRKILAETGHYLGNAIASVINILNLDAVILEGPIVEVEEFVSESLQQTVNRRALPYPAQHVKIMYSSLDEDGTAVGAATLILEQIFNNNKINLGEGNVNLGVGI